MLQIHRIVEDLHPRDEASRERGRISMIGERAANRISSIERSFTGFIVEHPWTLSTMDCLPFLEPEQQLALLASAEACGSIQASIFA